jgi:hypothetical protein
MVDDDIPESSTIAFELFKDLPSDGDFKSWLPAFIGDQYHWQALDVPNKHGENSRATAFLVFS